MAADNPGFRLSILGVVALSLFAALFARLYFLQVLDNGELQEEITANSIRVVHEQAPRGRILDRNQTVLVDSRLVTQVVIDLRKFADETGSDEDVQRRVYERLAAELAAAPACDPIPCPGAVPAEGEVWTAAAVEQTIEHNTIDQFAPVAIATDVSEDLEVTLLERSEDLPGISVRRTAVREYPYGTLAAHLLGYVGSISQEGLEAKEDHPLDYQAGDEIGRTGIELAYEDELRGQPGQTTYEVDAEGNVVRTINEQTFAPTRGHDVMLSLDVNVQYLAEQALTAQVEATNAPSGAVVVLDPNNGDVVAMASNPTFNPSEFITGISQERYRELTNPASGLPLNNWVIQGEYAPGSTFKPITAVAALRNLGDVYTPEYTFNDPGYYQAQGCDGESCQFENDESQPHGPVNLTSSLTVSSDAYYYQAGDFLWLRRDQIGDDALQQTAHDFGFTAKTDIELPSERPGFMFTPELRQEAHDENPEAFPFPDWRSGDNINMAIGQGDLGVTPLQLANAYASIANGGTLWQPQLANTVVEPRGDNLEVLTEFDPVELGHVDIPPEWRDPIVQGLVGVTSASGGTAVRAFENNPAGWPVAGKTGTAQRQGQKNTALFVGWGPVLPDQPPGYVAAAVVPEGGYGADAAAPVVARIFAGLADPAQMPVAPTAEQVLSGDLPAPGVQPNGANP